MTDILDYLQRYYYSETNISDESRIDDFLDDMPVWMRQHRDELKGELQRALNGECGPLEDPFAFLVLSRAAKRVEKTVLAEFGSVPECRLGTLPTGHVNARFVRDTPCLVIFDREMFRFINKVCKLLAGALTQVTTSNPQVFLDDETTVRLHSLLISMVAGDNVKHTEYSFPDPKTTGLAGKLSDAMILFVLSHEYAHLILGHQSTSCRSTRVGNREINIFLPSSWLHEHQADETGMKIATNTLISEMPEDRLTAFGLGILGYELFLAVIDQVERGRTLLPEKPNLWGSATHPPALQRKAFCREAIIKQFPSVPPGLKQIFQVSDSLANAIGEGWGRVIRDGVLHLSGKQIKYMLGDVD